MSNVVQQPVVCLLMNTMNTNHPCQIVVVSAQDAIWLSLGTCEN
jgi:hypothetical protein